MLTFRTAISFAVMAFVFALTAPLIAIQARALRSATQDAASAYMDATSRPRRPSHHVSGKFTNLAVR